MGLQKPSNHVMAGKATMHLVDYEDDDVEASSATAIDDGDDEHITISLEMEHITVSLGLWNTLQCSWGWRSTSQCSEVWRTHLCILAMVWS